MTKRKEKDNQSKPNRSPISQRQLNPCTPENILSSLGCKHSRYLKPPHAHSSTLDSFPSPKKSACLHIWWQVLPAFLYTFTSFECTSKGCAVQFPSWRNKNQYNHIVFICYLTFQAVFNFLLQLFLCICPCVCCICLHTCVQVCMQAPVHTRASRGQRLVLGCLPQLLPHLIF